MPGLSGQYFLKVLNYVKVVNWTAVLILWISSIGRYSFMSVSPPTVLHLPWPIMKHRSDKNIVSFFPCLTECISVGLVWLSRSFESACHFPLVIQECELKMQYQPECKHSSTVRTHSLFKYKDAKIKELILISFKAFTRLRTLLEVTGEAQILVTTVQDIYTFKPATAMWNGPAHHSWSLQH